MLGEEGRWLRGLWTSPGLGALPEALLPLSLDASFTFSHPFSLKWAPPLETPLPEVVQVQGVSSPKSRSLRPWEVGSVAGGCSLPGRPSASLRRGL